MGLMRGIGRAIGRFGRRFAVRSRWLARRLWLVMVADVLLTARRHWKRLDENEQDRLFELARKSGGRPNKNLTAKERAEATALLDKAGHIEFAGSVAGIVLPFRPLSRLAAKLLERRSAGKRPEPASVR